MSPSGDQACSGSVATADPDLWRDQTVGATGLKSLNFAPELDLSPRPEGDAARLAPLRLIATTDLHGQILSYDYFANRSLTGSGLARIACLIDSARERVPTALLLDNGDFLQGTALVEPGAGGKEAPGETHPAIEAFNQLGYDAAALGNHEFDYGLPYLQQALSGAKFPVLSANILRRKGPDPLQDERLFTPYVLLQRRLRLATGEEREISVGLLGLTPPETLVWNRRLLHDSLAARPMDETALAMASEMRRRGADLVICLAHTGIAVPGRPPDPEAQADSIAALPGIDAVIAGHSHLSWPPPETGAAESHDRLQSDGVTVAGTKGAVPILQPGHLGNCFGLIDFWLEARPAGGWSIRSTKTRVIEGASALAGLSAQEIRAAALPLRNSLAKAHRRALRSMRLPLGETSTRLSTHFALTADCQALRLIGEAKMAYIRRALAGSPEAHLPMVALVTPYRVGGRSGPRNYTDIAPGPLAFRNVLDLYPFPNTITAEVVSGATLLARLERSLAVYNRILPGLADQPLLSDAVPGFSALTAVGASYDIDLQQPLADETRPGGGRLRNFRIAGRMIGPDEEILVVTNSHLGALQSASHSKILLNDGRLCTAILADYIRDIGVFHASDQPGWRFAPVPGSSVLFDTSPRAVSQTGSIAAFRPEHLGLNRNGFLRFRLRL